MSSRWPTVNFGKVLRPNSRPYLLGPDEDANLVGMRLYGGGPFHREFKPAIQIAKKSHFLIRSGDVIFNKLFAWKGTFGIVPPSFDGMFVSDKFPTYQLDHNLVDPAFLGWYFRYPHLWEQARVMSTGSAALSKLTLNPPKFLLLTMPLPPLEEQRGIVARIDDLATQITEIRNLRQKASEEVKAIVTSYLNSISKAIDVCGTLGDILLSKPRNGWSARCDNAPEGIPVLSLGAVTGYRYRGSEHKRTSLYAPNDGHFWLRRGDLLITRSNTPELVGHAAIYDGTPSPCIYPDLMMRLDPDENIAESRFVWYWLQVPIVRDFIMKNAKGTSPTMKKVTQGMVMSIPFPSWLPIHDQRRLVARLDELQVEVDALKRLQDESAAELNALLPSILDRAFKGELL